MSGRREIRILLVDDHQLFREGLARLLAAEPDLTMVAHCATVEEGLAVLANSVIDLVLLDFKLENATGLEFLIAAREAGYAGKIVVLTGGLTEWDANQALIHGADGIFLKTGSPSLLLKCIRTVQSGEPWLDQPYLRGLISRFTLPDSDARGRLTLREQVVLHGVMQGMMNKEIAQRLQVSEGSVKATLQQLFQKTGVHTRGQLVRVALEQYSDQLPGLRC